MTEFAPGIPYKRVKETPRISEPQIWKLRMQRHLADKAGPHFDLRIVDEKSGKAYSWAVRNLPTNPGDKTLAVLQPTHTAAYSTFSGEIPKGTYGAGTVKLFSDDRVEVTKADLDHITFNVYKSNGDTERYALIKTGDDNWLWHNTTPTRKSRPQVPAEKPAYKSIDIDNIDINNSNQIISPKYDGALNAFVLRPQRHIEIYSYRPSVHENKLIDHTYRLPYYKITAPKALGNTVVLGEIFARDRLGNVLPSTETNSRLLSNVWRSRELQEKAPLDSVVFNVLRYKGRDVSEKPYSEKLKILKEITTAVPQLKLPPLAQTPEQKRSLLDAIKSGKHELSREGVVIYDTTQSTPIKSKLREDFDVHVRGIFPGEGRHKDKAAGGFTYSFAPTGPITGRVGGGFNDSIRKDMWKNQDKYIGQVARVFAQEQLPSGALRMPILKDFRSELWVKKASVKPFLYAQYMSREDNGKRKYTWIAHTTKEDFEKAKSHVLDNGYKEESVLHMLKQARGENSKDLTEGEYIDINPSDIIETDVDKRPTRTSLLTLIKKNRKIG